LREIAQATRSAQRMVLFGMGEMDQEALTRALATILALGDPEKIEDLVLRQRAIVARDLTLAAASFARLDAQAASCGDPVLRERLESERARLRHTVEGLADRFLQAAAASSAGTA
jgi:hypothetical protein